jgi:hypothetical protein
MHMHKPTFKQGSGLPETLGGVLCVEHHLASEIYLLHISHSLSGLKNLKL